MMVYILRRANFPTFGAMNEDTPGRGLFKFWAHMFDYRDGHGYGSHNLSRRSAISQSSKPTVDTKKTL
ncbi:hypothetical protein YC2023_083724 [Brassica napus]